MKKNKSNRLIAEFMGLEVVLLGRQNNLLVKKYDTEEFPTSIEYHSSWDWLMPVVIKMVSMELYYEFRADYYELYIEGNPLCIFSTTKEYDVNMTLRTLHNEVVEFIKWYNKKEQQQ